jgi:hypothetical protein
MIWLWPLNISTSKEASAVPFTYSYSIGTRDLEKSPRDKRILGFIKDIAYDFENGNRKLMIGCALLN